MADVTKLNIGGVDYDITDGYPEKLDLSVEFLTK